MLLILASCGASCSSTTGADSQRPFTSSSPSPPPELLKYRNDSANPFEPGGLLATDSYQVYANIESYPTLRAVILDPRAEPRVLELAIERSLLLVGPTRFFNDVRRDAARDPELFVTGVRRALLDRSRAAHVWVSDSAFIDEADMPRARARELFERMVRQVRSGESFDAVYRRAQAEHSYDDGPLRLTRVGNYGDWVLSAAKRTGEPFRSTAVPASHVEQLLRARAGDMLILEDDNPEERRLVLYHVREAYHPQRDVAQRGR